MLRIVRWTFTMEPATKSTATLRFTTTICEHIRYAVKLEKFVKVELRLIVVIVLGFISLGFNTGVLVIVGADGVGGRGRGRDRRRRVAPSLAHGRPRSAYMVPFLVLFIIVVVARDYTLLSRLVETTKFYRFQLRCRSCTKPFRFIFFLISSLRIATTRSTVVVSISRLLVVESIVSLPLDVRGVGVAAERATLEPVDGRPGVVVAVVAELPVAVRGPVGLRRPELALLAPPRRTHVTDHYTTRPDATTDLVGLGGRRLSGGRGQWRLGPGAGEVGGRRRGGGGGGAAPGGERPPLRREHYTAAAAPTAARLALLAHALARIRRPALAFALTLALTTVHALMVFVRSISPGTSIFLVWRIGTFLKDKRERLASSEGILEVTLHERRIAQTHQLIARVREWTPGRADGKHRRISTAA